MGKGCKRCPNGSFVAFDKAPGKYHRDCKSCPLGKTYYLDNLHSPYNGSYFNLSRKGHISATTTPSKAHPNWSNKKLLNDENKYTTEKRCGKCRYEIAVLGCVGLCMAMYGDIGLCSYFSYGQRETTIWKVTLRISVCL